MNQLETSTCKTCGGRCYRNLSFGGPWLHALDADWHDNPHDAHPTEATDGATEVSAQQIIVRRSYTSADGLHTHTDSWSEQLIRQGVPGTIQCASGYLDVGNHVLPDGRIMSTTWEVAQ